MADIGYTTNLGWYVSRDTGALSEYLHQDGVWRSSTKGPSGHFPSEEVALY